MIQNKAPGKDVSAEDMAEKVPLASKKIIHIFPSLKLMVSLLGMV